jgi:hypothetical protein
MQEFKTIGELVKYLQQFDQTTPMNMLKSIYDENGERWSHELCYFSPANIQPNREKDVIEIFV